MFGDLDEAAATELRAQHAPSAGGAGARAALITDDRKLNSLMAHLRGQVAELRRLEQNGAAPADLADRKHRVLRLQEHLAYTVRDLLNESRTLPG